MFVAFLGIYFFAFFSEICLQATLKAGSNRGQKKELLPHGKSIGHPQEEHYQSRYYGGSS
jgi:hypothetical protein